MWTPRSRPAEPSGSFSAITLTRPSASPMIRARPLPRVRVLLGDHLEPGLPGRFLRVPGEGHLGERIHAPRHLAVVHRHHRPPEHLVDDQHRFGKTHVGQARSSDQVADGPDAGLARLHQLVDLHEAALVHLDAATGRNQPVAEGPAPDRDDDRLRPRGPRDDLPPPPSASNSTVVNLPSALGVCL